jgi:hypothetical protein
MATFIGTPKHRRDSPFLCLYYSHVHPNAHMPRINRGMIYLGACLIAGIRLARNKQVNVQVVPTSVAIEESVDLAYEIYNRVFRKVPERLMEKLFSDCMSIETS